MFLALALFALCYLLVSRVLPRINQVLAERHEALSWADVEKCRGEGDAFRAHAEAVLAEARHDAARTRQQALEQGNALIAEARARGQRDRAEILVRGRAAVESERTAAEAALHRSVPELASALASRIVGEPVAASAEHAN
ncbi:F0F1 ATP synthase subunit B family protein [Streptomyces sp. SAS_270]|uniref:F0F1 ATP synthase subunit B family protein n=1 Tax=Streptomyces sp. SAS_270 TaxID=3412748 RepID=UPI00403CB6C8